MIDRRSKHSLYRSFSSRRFFFPRLEGGSRDSLVESGVSAAGDIHFAVYPDLVADRTNRIGDLVIGCGDRASRSRRFYPSVHRANYRPLFAEADPDRGKRGDCGRFRDWDGPADG